MCAQIVASGHIGRLLKWARLGSNCKGKNLIYDLGRRHQSKTKLFPMKGISSFGLTVGDAPCSNVVCKGWKYLCLLESDPSTLTDFLSPKPECHHPTERNCSLLHSPMHILLITQQGA